ncbi:hypothetical protein CLIB1444_23S00738 [[Candida] jaroonii]|uniref:Uncharacterized protein n=1 Tax=[Candida] jaroonii TaxID=467808 RepID=A0ACA9YFT7_9ASCO|nr:hypothetical protein CLIB1444_23S00738 [[Candida] jaroonii]
MESTPLIEDDLKDLPTVVKEIVPLVDNPRTLTITFRYFVLSTLFVVPGAFIDTMNSFRTTSAAYSIFFVQIASHWCGKWMARTLPNKDVRIGKFSFNLNPGPWSIKETALITITANSGATGNLATNGISLAQLHFGEVVHPLTAICFMLAIVFVGYAYAAIAKDLLLYDPQFIWPQALMQTTLLRSQEKADGISDEGEGDSGEVVDSRRDFGAIKNRDESDIEPSDTSSTGPDPTTSKGEEPGTSVSKPDTQMRVFFYVLIAVTIWQFFPEFIFPLTSSLAVICWIAPYSPTWNFIGSGMGGMGFMNFTLDWANITSSIMLFPYWIQVIQFVAFVIGCWILIPIVKFGGFNDFGLMSNSIFTETGAKYPTNELLTPDLQFNQTAYEHYGPANLGAQRLWNVFFDYAAYVSGVVWVVMFGYERLVQSWKISRSKDKTYGDRLNKLAKNYDPIPMSWYYTLFGLSFGMLMIIFWSGQMFMPWWCCIIALILGSIIVTPLAWLYALSNFQLPIGTFNELFFGYLVQSQSVHPASGSVFGSVAGDAWYRAQYHLECMKLGFYIHLPPKEVFLAQIYGELIGVPINYLALSWVLGTKGDYLKGKLKDPLNQWTGQEIESIHTNAIQYVVLGPSRLFHNYPLLPLGFVVGLIAPISLYYLHRRYKKVGFDYWNTTVFFSSMAKFHGNLSTGGLSKFIGGTITMFYIFRYHHHHWKNYNYILAAAFDTGYNLSVLLIFLVSSVLFTFTMPHWWGNDATSIEKCYSL